MPFVKLDCGILNSTLWIDRAARELFITALLMAEPREVLEPLPQIAIGSLSLTGWEVPPGWYGFVEAAGPGIVHRAGLDDRGEMFVAAMDALSRLGEPDPASRSHAFDGRRLVRVDGGFIVLNFVHYREKDSTTADRSRRWRERQKAKSQGVASRVTDTPTRVIRHQAEAEAEAEQKRERRHAPLHTSHKTHAACGRVCVPAMLHTQFVSARNHDGANDELRTWYSAVNAEWTDGARKDVSPGGDAFAFWRARFSEQWPAPKTASGPRWAKPEGA